EQITLAPPAPTLDGPSMAQRAEALAEQDEAPFDVAEDEPEVEFIELADVHLTLAEDDLTAEDAAQTESNAADANPGPRFLTAPEAQGEMIETLVSEAVAEARPLEPGLSRSMRPRTRPAVLRDIAQAASPLAAPEVEGTRVAALPTASDADPAQLVPGTRVVQLGAFDSEAIARAEWERMQSRHGDYLSGKSRLIQRATSGGRDFWRLRVVGFADGSDTQRFCAAMIAQDQPCIPVTIR
ncbi:SPOR domain-containing protein, partial [Jannaschia aquimarina]